MRLFINCPKSLEKKKGKKFKKIELNFELRVNLISNPKFSLLKDGKG